MTQVFFTLIFIFVFFCNLGGINPSGSIALTAFMMFVFLAGLSLALRLTCVNKEIVRLNLVIPNSLMLFLFLN